MESTRDRILFNCPLLREYFSTSIFELDLTTGQVYTFLTLPEDIGVPCQQEEFNMNLLAEKLENSQIPTEHRIEELERIPLIKKLSRTRYIPTQG